jgi:DNA-binding HxlR family transcriptional regulator
VEYSRTPLGESLREPFSHLYTWAVEHADDIGARQRAYDARSASAHPPQ